MSFPYTQNNHLTCVLEPDKNQCSVSVGECVRHPESPMAEAARAAHDIYMQSAGRTIWLCLSGGVDSEAMALAFIQAGVPFKAAILKFHDRLNWFDIKYAVRFCASRGIDYTVFPLDALRFLDSEKLIFYGEKYRCRSPQFATHFALLDQLQGGVPILSWQPPGFIRDGHGKVFLGLPDYSYFAYQRYFEAGQRAGVPFFFLYTPELIYSFLRLPIMQRAMFTPGFKRPADYALKLNCYQSGGFAVEPRPDKYTGFEIIKRRVADRDNPAVPVFENRYRKPLEKLTPIPTHTIYRFPKTYFQVEESI